MKKALMMIGLGTISFLWGSQEMTIQVINAVYEKSITHDFEEKLKQSALPITKKVENGHYIVTLGTYKDEESAKKDLEKVRTVVMKDAFIRPVQRSTAVAAKSVKAKSKAVAVNTAKKVNTAEKTKAAAKNVKTETVVASATVQEVKAAVVPNADKKSEVKTQAVAPTSETSKQPVAITEGASCPITPTPTEVKTIPVLASVVMVERNELRRQEIHDAIEYYKNSPYHRFVPVKLQP